MENCSQTALATGEVDIYGNMTDRQWDDGVDSPGPAGMDGDG